MGLLRSCAGHRVTQMPLSSKTLFFSSHVLFHLYCLLHWAAVFHYYHFPFSFLLVCASRKRSLTASEHYFVPHARKKQPLTGPPGSDHDNCPMCVTRLNGTRGGSRREGNSTWPPHPATRQDLLTDDKKTPDHSTAISPASYLQDEDGETQGLPSEASQARQTKKTGKHPKLQIEL